MSLSPTRSPTIAFALAAAALAGCCPAIKPETGKLLDPLPASEQLAQINDRAALIDTVRANGKVTIEWIDKDNKQHRESADGSLLFRKRTWNRPGPAGPVTYYDVMLYGKVAGQYVFELGENEKNFWIAFRVDPKTASIADKQAPVEDSNPADPANRVIPVRAGTIPFILGVAPVQRRTLPPIVLTNSKNVEVLTLNANGAVWPVSVLELSRYEPGNPSAVRMYWPSGILEGEATLHNYHTVATSKPAEDPDDPPVAGPPVRLPFFIRVEYPSRKARIQLEVEHYDINVPFKDAYFQMPPFSREGLKVETINRTPEEP